jgi:tyrosine recombinase (fragment)
MEIYTPKTKIKLSPVIRNGREFVEVTFGNDNDIRLSLSKEENVLLVGGRAYLPAEDFVLAEFFDRYVKMAFIDYSAIKETAPRKEEDKRPPLPEGYLEKLQQVRYSDHTVRVYTSYFRDFQQHFEGRKIENGYSRRDKRLPCCISSTRKTYPPASKTSVSTPSSSITRKFSVRNGGVTR